MDQNEINCARNGLLEVAERLRQQATATQPESARTHGQQGAFSDAATSLGSGIPTSRPAENSQQIIEHRRLFGYVARSRKQPGKKKTVAPKQKIQTFSLKFVCLSTVSADKPPTCVKERTMLANMGLGDATVAFNSDGDSFHFHEKILAAFPKLNSAGYELLLFDRSGEHPSFCHLNHPYIPKKLKEVAGQCKIYIRPLQKDLVEEAGDDTIQENVGPLIACITCNAMVPMTIIEDHHQSMHGGQPKKKRRNEVCIVDMLQQQPQDDGGETSRSYDIKSTLRDMVPSASSEEIDSALQNAHGDADQAAQDLLALQDDDHEELEIIESSSGIVGPSCNEVTLEAFRQHAVDESAQRQRFCVSREDGTEELKRDILGCYKSPCVNLKAKPRVKFEGEDGVGSGPTREFLLCAIKIVEEGIEKSGKPLVFFEGEDDHKVPIHDQALRCTGAFKAIGRIIGHSFVHGGPVVYGISPAVVQYWRLTYAGAVDDVALESIELVLQDIPDFELRSLIPELENLPSDASIPPELRENLTPYLFESGLDVDMLLSDRKLLVQGLVMFNVINKRRRELDDIAKGMNEVGVHSFIGKCSLETLEILFPPSKTRYISAEDIKNYIVFEESCGHEETIVQFYDYLTQLEKYEPGRPSMTDLCCFWTATNNLPPRSSALQVKFDDGQNQLPFAETCFLSIALPTMHKTYTDFEKYMDIALSHGAMGLHHS